MAETKKIILTGSIIIEEDGKYYNLSAHMLWLGEKTRFLQSAHVEYLKGKEKNITEALRLYR